MYQLQATADGVRIDAYLRKNLPELPPQVIRESFARRDVKLNGRRVKADARVAAGDMIQVYCMEQQQNPLDIVYEDDDVLIVNKRAGISVEPDARGGLTLTDLACRHTGITVSACHRLDNQTCGLLVFAKTEKASTVLEGAFRDRTLDKRYICMVKGRMKPPQAVCRAFLRKDADAARVWIQDSEGHGAKPIITEYETLEADDAVSRLRVHLITGRTHQIRAHMAALGHPILGDDLYGDRALNRARHVQGKLLLCAASLTLQTDGALPQLDGKKFEVKCPF